MDIKQIGRIYKGVPLNMEADIVKELKRCGLLETYTVNQHWYGWKIVAVKPEKGYYELF